MAMVIWGNILRYMCTERMCSSTIVCDHLDTVLATDPHAVFGDSTRYTVLIQSKCASIKDHGVLPYANYK
jgi:hypothetical protein